MLSFRQGRTLSGRRTSVEDLMMPLKEQKKKIPKVFSHRAAYKGMVLLLLTLITTLLLFIGGICLPFDFTPYKNELIKDLSHNSDVDDAILWAKKRILAVFMLPIGGGLSVTVLTIIHIWAMFRRGERFRTTVVASIATLFWTMIVALWCGFISYDLGRYPNDVLGLTDSWGELYIQMIQQYVSSGTSKNQSKAVHSIHQCCGVVGFDDFFTNRNIDKALHFSWPKKVNSTHLEIVPETCCKDDSECHRQPIGQPIDTSHIYTTGCLLVFRFPLLSLTKWMTINSCLSFIFCVGAFLLMYWERRKMKTRREAKKKKKYTAEKEEATYF